MVVLKGALNEIRDFIHDSIDKGQLGTDGSAVTENDTGVRTPDATTLLSVTAKTKADKAVKIDYVLPSTGGTTTTYKEFELQDSVNGVGFTLNNFTGINFTSGGTEDLKFSQIIYTRGA